MTQTIFRLILVSIILVLLSINITSAKIIHDEDFEVTNKLEATSANIEGVEENGRFRTVLQLPLASVTEVKFELSFPIPAQSGSPEVTLSDSNSKANGSISPGQKITFDHQVTRCITDFALEELLIAKTVENGSTAFLKFTIIIDVVGENTCEINQEGFNSSFSPNLLVVVVLSVVFFVFIYFSTNKKQINLDK